MPVVLADQSVYALLIEAQRQLGLSQEGLGELVGASRRTVSRWWVGGRPYPHQLETLVKVVHPLDRALASALAVQAGTTLLKMGLETAPAPPPTALVADSVVCAAAEALEVTPTQVRAALRAAFGRARALGLTVEQLDDALAEPAAKLSAVSATKKRAAK